jgi:hypothetical protein
VRNYLNRYKLYTIVSIWYEAVWLVLLAFLRITAGFSSTHSQLTSFRKRLPFLHYHNDCFNIRGKFTSVELLLLRKEVRLLALFRAWVSEHQSFRTGCVMRSWDPTSGFQLTYHRSVDKRRCCWNGNMPKITVLFWILRIVNLLMRFVNIEALLVRVVREVYDTRIFNIKR